MGGGESVLAARERASSGVKELNLPQVPSGRCGRSAVHGICRAMTTWSRLLAYDDRKIHAAACRDASDWSNVIQFVVF